MHTDRHGRKYTRYYVLHDGAGRFLANTSLGQSQEMQRYTRDISEAWVSFDSTEAHELANTLHMRVMALNAYE